jgi:hypothetical protein
MSADRNSENVFDFDNPDYYINATVVFDKKKKKCYSWFCLELLLEEFISDNNEFSQVLDTVTKDDSNGN